MAAEATHSKGGGTLFSKDLSKASEDAAEAIAIAALVAARNTSKEHTQHASQTCCVDTAALLSLTQQGEEAGGDSSEDATHRVGGYARLLGDFADY